jgi:alpha-amylase
LSLEGSRDINLTDQWLGLEIGLESDQAGGIFAYPVRTVSQSESGFELVHQSVCVQPHWKIKGDANGSWACQINLRLKTGVTTASQNTDQASVTSE